MNSESIPPLQQSETAWSELQSSIGSYAHALLHLAVNIPESVVGVCLVAGIGIGLAMYPFTLFRKEHNKAEEGEIRFRVYRGGKDGGIMDTDETARVCLFKNTDKKKIHKFINK